MEVFKVPPFDQNLMVEGRYLTSDSNLQTLGQLRLLPKSLIYLRADEPTLGSAAAAASVSEAECWTSQDPEEGFKGKPNLNNTTFWAFLSKLITQISSIRTPSYLTIFFMITSPMKLATTSHAAFFELNRFGLIFITSQKIQRKT